MITDLESKIKIVFCLSGKVHGSLARAGKVKGQTPKVISDYVALYLLYYKYFNLLLFVQ